MRKIILFILNTLSDAALIAIAILAVPCAVLSAYEVPFSIGPLVTASILFGVCLSVWMHPSKYGFVAGILYGVVLIPLFLIKRRAILYGFRLFRFTMLDLVAADIPFLTSPEPLETVEELSVSQTASIGWFVLFVMAFFGLAVAWSLIRSRMILLPLIVPLPIFMLGLVYTDLPLEHWTVYLLMVYLGVCLVSGELRVYETEHYGLVTMIVLFGMLALGGLIFLFSPPDEFTPLTFEQRQEMVGDRLNSMYESLRGNLNNRVKRTEDLTDENEWKRTGDMVLTMRGTSEGEMYLSAYSLGEYRDNAWRNVPVYGGEWKSMNSLGSRISPTDSVSIHAEGSEMLYHPYGFAAETDLKINETYIPADGKTDYAFMYSDRIPEAGTVSEAESAYYDWARENYSIAEKNTKDALLDYIASAGIQNTGDNYRTAILVASHVQSVGFYSTEPGNLPKGKDFVLYFLEESNKGYCVHFASATTALLQAMDIPARYVFGYRFFTVTNEEKTVTDEMAHAWTEVYCPGIGWLKVESTAGAKGWQEPEATAEPDSAQQPEQTPEPSPEGTPEPSESPYDPEQDGDSEDGDNTGEEDEDQSSDSAGEETDNDSNQHLITLPTNQPELHSLNLWWLLCFLLIPASVFGLRTVRRRIADKRIDMFRQKNAREAILAMYRYQQRMERYGAPKDPNEFTLAEEAAFSDHAMTAERKMMHEIIRRSVAELEKQPRWKRFLYRWILFLI